MCIDGSGYGIIIGCFNRGVIQVIPIDFHFNQVTEVNTGRIRDTDRTVAAEIAGILHQGSRLQEWTRLP